MSLANDNLWGFKPSGTAKSFTNGNPFNSPSGILSIADGGTNTDVIGSAGTVAYSDGVKYNFTGVGTAGYILSSNGASAPTWVAPSSGLVTRWSGGTTGLTPNTLTSGDITIAGTLVAANGGTGQSVYAVGDILAADTTTSLSKIPDVILGNALISGGVNALPSWGKIELTTHVVGTLAIANGGTNSSIALNNNRVMVSTAGQIVESGPATNGQVLIGSTGNSPSWANLTAGSGVSITNGSNSITIALSSPIAADLITGTAGVVSVQNNATFNGNAVNGIYQTNNFPLYLNYLGPKLRTITDSQSFANPSGSTHTFDWLSDTNLIFPIGMGVAWVHIFKLRIVGMYPGSTNVTQETEFTVRQTTSDVIVPQADPILFRQVHSDVAQCVPNTTYSSGDWANYLLRPGVELPAGQIVVSNTDALASTVTWYLQTECTHIY